jgi:hypothetical protein
MEFEALYSKLLTKNTLSWLFDSVHKKTIFCLMYIDGKLSFNSCQLKFIPSDETSASILFEWDNNLGRYSLMVCSLWWLVRFWFESFDS